MRRADHSTEMMLGGPCQKFFLAPLQGREHPDSGGERGMGACRARFKGVWLVGGWVQGGWVGGSNPPAPQWC